MAIDFHEFHLIELPRRMRAEAGLVAARLARELSPLCIRIRHTDNAYTYAPQPHNIAIVAGTEADQQLQLGEDEWQQLLANRQLLAILIDKLCNEKVQETEFLQRWQAVMAAMYYAVQ